MRRANAGFKNEIETRSLNAEGDRRIRKRSGDAAFEKGFERGD